MKERLVVKLNERGYKTEITEVVKNGVTMCGLIFKTESNIAPTIYIDQFLTDCTYGELDSLVDKLISTYEEAVKNVPVIDTKKIMGWNYVKDNLQLCIQRKGNEDIVKRDFLDLEMYIRVRVSNDGTFRVKPEHLKSFGVSEDELFRKAIECTRKTVEVHSNAIITNKNMAYGASSIYFVDVLKEVADWHESDLVIIPSSIHECILYPICDLTSFTEINKIIQDVNATEVAPEEVLSDHAYVYSKTENKIFTSLEEYIGYLKRKTDFLGKICDCFN